MAPFHDCNVKNKLIFHLAFHLGYVDVATIPTGATNIRVKELGKTVMYICKSVGYYIVVLTISGFSSGPSTDTIFIAYYFILSNQPIIL